MNLLNRYLFFLVLCVYAHSAIDHLETTYSPLAFARSRPDDLKAIVGDMADLSKPYFVAHMDSMHTAIQENATTCLADAKEALIPSFRSVFEALPPHSWAHNCDLVLKTVAKLSEKEAHHVSQLQQIITLYHLVQAIQEEGTSPYKVAALLLRPSLPSKDFLHVLQANIPSFQADMKIAKRIANSNILVCYTDSPHFLPLKHVVALCKGFHLLAVPKNITNLPHFGNTFAKGSHFISACAQQINQSVEWEDSLNIVMPHTAEKMYSEIYQDIQHNWEIDGPLRILLYYARQQRLNCPFSHRSDNDLITSIALCKGDVNFTTISAHMQHLIPQFCQPQNGKRVTQSLLGNMARHIKGHFPFLEHRNENILFRWNNPGWIESPTFSPDHFLCLIFGYIKAVAPDTPRYLLGKLDKLTCPKRTLPCEIILSSHMPRLISPMCKKICTKENAIYAFYLNIPSPEVVSTIGEKEKFQFLDDMMRMTSILFLGLKHAPMPEYSQEGLITCLHNTISANNDPS